MDGNTCMNKILRQLNMNDGQSGDIKQLSKTDSATFQVTKAEQNQNLFSLYYGMLMEGIVLIQAFELKKNYMMVLHVFNNLGNRLWLEVQTVQQHK